ncbi:uncharacterized protein TNIN_172131 [Trichonephila inaurata madagascariensis]|uniref:Uncharacterized protein n=1 Tax=Trichonephila inaurata madagascariensis TaxID=2747483 RepID=A0A8X6XN02_9ARAC|nr:uncharacterized protein TNIN_172131 [Trichonephila inaurata madagascariensis]
MKELKYDLDKCNCITILNDASNHGNKKIYPIVVRFFQPYVGVQVKILDFQDQPGETSDIIVNYLNQVLTDNNLTAKVVAFCGDNANVNFGGAVRRGTNNVLTKLQSSLKKDLIASFYQAVLQLEGQTVSAIEAAKVINELKDNLTQKQTNHFLPFMVRQLMLKLKDSGTDIDEEFVKRTATEFYKTSREYLEQWTYTFLPKKWRYFIGQI